MKHQAILLWMNANHFSYKTKFSLRVPTNYTFSNEFLRTLLLLFCYTHESVKIFMINFYYYLLYTVLFMNFKSIFVFTHFILTLNTRQSVAWKAFYKAPVLMVYSSSCWSRNKISFIFSTVSFFYFALFAKNKQFVCIAKNWLNHSCHFFFFSIYFVNW
jgi:hypothetical protein